MTSGPCLRRCRVVRRYMPTNIKCHRLYVKLSSSIHVSMYFEPFQRVNAANTGFPCPKVPIRRKLRYQFAPRYRDIYDKVGEALYGFKHPSQYDEDMVLKPIRKLSPELIIEEWENIQRIMVSLALKTTTQSTIVRKLSAFARKNKTRRALWEYESIFRSL